MSNVNYYKGIDSGVVAILDALKSEYRIINVIMEPYKSVEVIEKIIEIESHSKILYLSFREKKLNKDLICESLLFENFSKIDNFYDLIIIDDISFYSNYNRSAISAIVDLCYKVSKKVLIFAIEEIIYKSLTIVITTQNKCTHFKEPRVIVTRFDLRERMPYIFYTYLEWFYSKGENAIVYVEEEKAKGVYDNFVKLESQFEDLEVILYKGKSSDLYNSLNKRKNSIIIHSNIQGLIDNIKNTNVIMYNDSKNFYNYKQIVFLCGRYSVLTEKKELILLSKKESENIDRARKIARLYNEIPWRD